MVRVRVSLNDELLAEIDAVAAESRVERIAVIRTALESYLEAQKKVREDVGIRREMAEACRGMDALADRLGSWDPVRLIREFRGGRSTRLREPRKRRCAATRMRR